VLDFLPKDSSIRCTEEERSFPTAAKRCQKKTLRSSSHSFFLFITFDVYRFNRNGLQTVSFVTEEVERQVMT
ncbi:hypothetical protein NPIL_18281, partial [Nephila pilipes]